jgi:hypothetical protein
MTIKEEIMTLRFQTPKTTLTIAVCLVACLSATTIVAGRATLHTQDDIPSTIAVAPTDTTSTQFRGGAGRYGQPRTGGKTHSGVDIVANQSSLDPELYRVMAMHDGKVAYARVNGTQEDGYGYTVVIDHGDGFYSLYAHLAINASKDLVKIGDDVKAGKVIGYIFDPVKNEPASGNARSESVVSWDKLQTHVELFTAPAGRSSSGALAPLRTGGATVDPTVRLKDLGYKG